MKNKVAIFRLEKGMSQETLAANAGISRPYLSEIETGAQTNITNKVMTKLATALGKSVSDIFFADNVV